MISTIGKRFTFDAAHRLGRHEGKCSQPHGHTYILEIDLTGPVHREGSGQGMVVDYYIIKRVIDEEIMARFDHKDLNAVCADAGFGVPEIDNVTTAEHLAYLIATLLVKRFYELAPHAVLSRVRLQETPNSWAEWRPESNRS